MAIEVNWTSGGLNKLDVWRVLLARLARLRQREALRELRRVALRPE